jgi:hypothetical protein
MSKTEVYSWRVSPETKAALEEEARREGMTLAALLDTIAEEWLRVRHHAALDDESEQERLRDAAAKCFGVIDGENSRRSETARKLVRERLGRRRAS